MCLVGPWKADWETEAAEGFAGWHGLVLYGCTTAAFLAFFAAVMQP